MTVNASASESTKANHISDDKVTLTKTHALQRHSYTSKNDNVQFRSLNVNALSSLDNNLRVSQDSDTDANTNENSVIQIDDGIDSLVVEAAVSIVINGIHYAVLMASPSQLEYLALGFLFSEGLIEHRHELFDCHIYHMNNLEDFESFTDDEADRANRFKKDVDDSFDGSTDRNVNYSNTNTDEQLLTQLQDYDVYVIELTLSQRCHQRIIAQKRQLAGRTGCGMCGITGLMQALPDLSRYQKTLTSNPSLNPSLDDLLMLKERVNRAQQTHRLTGAAHAAATLYKGELKLFEDVGRHNALDKLIGWQLRHDATLDYVIMTSRISIELVQKSIRAPIPWLVGLSAPTSTAVTVAKRYGLGLGGFLRDNRVSFYNLPYSL